MAHEVFQRGNQENQQFALLAVIRIEPAFLEQAAEEFPGEVLGVMRRAPTASYTGIERGHQ